MNIELKLNFDAVQAVNNHLQKVYKMGYGETVEQRVCKSIAFDLANKFDTRAKALIRKNSLFEANKLYKMTIKYHEAWSLQLILMDVMSNVENSYERNIIQKLINNLNQKIV